MFSTMYLVNKDYQKSSLTTLFGCYRDGGIRRADDSTATDQRHDAISAAAAAAVIK